MIKKTALFLLMILSVSLLFADTPESVIDSEQLVEEALEEDSNILIFSSTHSPVSYLKQKKGVIKIEIVSFDRINSIKVNGEELKIKPDNEIQFDLPFDLTEQKDDKMDFEITARSGTEITQKIFTVYYGTKPRPKKSPFKLITILSSKGTDNVNSTKEDDDKLSATKSVLTVVPRYSFYLDKDSTLLAKGIILRERYTDEAFVDKEVSYTQLALRWTEKRTFLGDLSIEVGNNDIRLNNNSGSLVGSVESSVESYISAGMMQNLGKGESWDLKFQVKNKDSKSEVSNINYDTDATESTLSAGIKLKFLGIKSTSKASYVLNDAEGKYEDGSTWNLSLKLNYPMGKLTPAIGFKMKTETMGIEDPQKDDKISEEVTQTPSVKLSYKVFPKMIVALLYKVKTLTSNVSSSNYENVMSEISLTYIF